MSIILSIESSAELASVALQVGPTSADRSGRSFSRQADGVQSHSHSLLPMVQTVLADAGLRLDQCEAIAFGAGPGSFTGVRTACGIAQGLAYGSGLPVVAVDTLAAIAQAARDASGVADVLVAIDARMGEVYWGQYRWDDAAARWHVMRAPSLGAPAAVTPQGAVHACGNGWTVHAQAFASAGSWPSVCDGTTAVVLELIPGLVAHAVQIAALAQGQYARGEVGAARDARPIYLRNDVALTSLERAIKRAEAAA